MRHYPSLILPVLLLISCSQSPQGDHDQRRLEQEINDVQTRVNNSYKPGLGEFMTDIQVHHAKLWFAGENENWKLADFEIKEIKESLDDIQKYCSDRPEVKAIPMIFGAVDSVSAAIEKHDRELFKAGFTSLTSTCNSCHRATSHEFNMIKIPEYPPFSNQEFKGERSRQQK